ncbi:MAG TPA: protein kinase, partial [Gemmataceae bacterium]|nr:protein kinase [Gemmataceae bacterium]
MSEPESSRPVDTDRNLLFGVLALQADLLDRTQFVEGCAAWAARKTVPLSDLLVERGWLTPEARAAVEHLLEWALKKHGDARNGLAATVDEEVRRSLQEIEDDAVRKSLVTMGEARPGETVPDDPAAGQRYLLSRLHATGGIGRVWVAYDSGLGREVALKELRPEYAGHAAARARFVKEARITGQLEHPGIVPVHELTTRDGHPIYTMRFLHGRTLTEVTRAYHARRAERAATALDLAGLLNTFVAVCNAVAYAHARGVIHRDLKGQNVLVGEYGEVIVLDWGLAKVVGPREGEGIEPPALVEVPADGDATSQGQVIGTPSYMAPEQAAGRLDQIDRRTDVYGLGAILYEILTGRPPFSGSDRHEVLRRVREEAPPRPRQVCAGVPPALEAVCLKALARDPGDRYATAEELARDVQRWLADEPPSAYRETR